MTTGFPDSGRIPGRGCFLDHSSVRRLAADLERRRGGVFRFDAGGAVGGWWRLACCETPPAAASLRLTVVACGGDGAPAAYEFAGCRDGALYHRTESRSWRVFAADGPFTARGSVDGNLRSRLDDNLRRVFS